MGVKLRHLILEKNVSYESLKEIRQENIWTYGG
jgi:hypothetical protein